MARCCRRGPHLRPRPLRRGDPGAADRGCRPATAVSASATTSATTDRRVADVGVRPHRPRYDVPNGSGRPRFDRCDEVRVGPQWGRSQRHRVLRRSAGSQHTVEQGRDSEHRADHGQPGEHQRAVLETRRGDRPEARRQGRQVRPAIRRLWEDPSGRDRGQGRSVCRCPHVRRDRGVGLPETGHDPRSGAGQRTRVAAEDGRRVQ